MNRRTFIAAIAAAAAAACTVPGSDSIYVADYLDFY